MPLMKRRSEKAFEHNLKAELAAGKPKDQSLAIAYSVKRKAKKAHGGKMYAEGGSISASNEKRPMPDDRHDDSMMVSRNSADHAPMRGDDAKTQDDISYQSKTGMKTTRIKHPKMVASDVVQARLRDEEDDLMSSARPASPDEQPSRQMDEEGPDRPGPRVPDMEDEHSTHRRPYAKGGEIERSDEMRHTDGRYEDDLQDLDPSHDEGAGMAHRENEMGPDRPGPKVPDMEEPHSEHDEMYHDNMHDDSTEASDTMGRSASGGMDQDDEEMEIDHDASVTAAIMARRKKMAEGGEILRGKSQDIHSHGSYDTHEDADQVDLSRNADEDANEEDQMSFDALRKENYSESEGLRHMESPMDSNEDEPEHEEMDVHDRSVVGMIRSKMRKKSALTR